MIDIVAIMILWCARRLISPDDRGFGMRFAWMLSATRLAWMAALLVALLTAALALYAPQTALAQSPSLTATVNDDRSVTLTLADGPSNWWFKINYGGTCTAATGTTVSNIKGYQVGTHAVGAYSDSGCQQHLDAVDFTIPTATLAATVNNDRSVDLTLTGGPSNWWFRIGGGSCTAVSGTTVSGISGYQSGTYNVNAYSNSGCNYHVASSSFTIPTITLATTVNNDRSVDLTLTGGPSNWWFKIGWGTCTAATGTTVSGIQGYKAGTHSVAAYSDSGCNYHVASSSFTIPTTTLAAVVNNDRSVDLTLTGGPSSWWFRINSWGTCTAATGTTVSNIQGYKAGTHAVAAYSNSGCNYHIAAASFTMPVLPVPAAPASVVGYRGNTFIDVEWAAVTGATSYDVEYRRQSYGSWTRAETATTGTSTKITGTTNLGGYFIAVRANNSYGSSAWTSDDVPHATYPLGPSAITTSRESTTLTVSWTMCDMSVDWCNGWSPVTGYLVDYSSDGGSTWTRSHTLTSYTSGQAHIITNTDASKGYKVRVKIENRMGGDWVQKNAPALPGAPEYFNVATATSGSTVTSTLGWKKPTDASGAVGYEVECQYTNNSAWTDCKTVAATTDANVRNITVASTTTNKVTALRVRANKSGSLGAWATPIPDPTGFLAQYQGSDLKMRWLRATGTGTTNLSYQIDCSTDSGATYTHCHPTVITPNTGNEFQATHSVTGITNLRLRWTDGEATPVQYGGWVLTPVPTYTPPGAPTNIQRTDNVIGVTVNYTITWDRPAGEDAADKIGYEVQCTRANNSAWGDCTSLSGAVGDKDTVAATTNASLTLSATTDAYSELRKVRVRSIIHNWIVSGWTERTTW